VNTIFAANTTMMMKQREPPSAPPTTTSVLSPVFSCTEMDGEVVNAVVAVVTSVEKEVVAERGWAVESRSCSVRGANTTSLVVVGPTGIIIWAGGFDLLSVRFG